MTHPSASHRPSQHHRNTRASTAARHHADLFKIHNLRTHLGITIRWTADAGTAHHPVLILSSAASRRRVAR
jgi:hypothetical protein